MKIIVRGRIFEETTRQFSCQECGSVMEATIAELGPVQSDQRDGDYYVVRCPVCRKNIYLDAAAVRTGDDTERGRYR